LQPARNLTKPNPPKAKPVKAAKVKKLTAPKRRKLLEKRAEALSRELVHWRDGDVCVEEGMGKCSSVLQWGHFIPQGKSPSLQYAVGNTFRQCSGHNTSHYYGDQTMIDWYIMTFGKEAYHALQADYRSRIKTKYQEWELEEVIAEHERLLENRPAFHTPELLAELGYFGKWPRMWPKG